MMQKRARNARRALAGQGLVEAVTWSFVSKEQAEAFGGGEPALALANPIAADLSDMRPSLLPGLVAAAGRNAARGLGDQDLFEVGQIFFDADRDRPAPRGGRRAARTDAGAGRHWSAPAREAGVFDAKADAMALLQCARRRRPAACRSSPAGRPGFIPAARRRCNSDRRTIVGHFGELHPRALKIIDVEGPIAAFEIILDALPAPKAKPTKIKPKLELSDLQPVSRDFAFIVDRDAAAGDLVKAAQGADRTLIADVTVFDVYEGAGVPEGKKSIGRRRHAAAARKDADRRGDRGGGAEDRRGGAKEMRRDAEGMTTEPSLRAKRSNPAR